LLNIDNWLDKCSNDEPDSIIYDPEFSEGIAVMQTKQLEPDLKAFFKFAADLCTKIGLNQDKIDERLNDISECQRTYLETMKNDITDEFEKLCQYKQEQFNQVQKMLSDLYLPPYEPNENLTLLNHCKLLKIKFDELNVVKQKRMTRLHELRDQQAKHCRILGIEAPQFKIKTGIPTEEELVKLTNAVSDLVKEERRRKDKYNLLKDMILRCFEQLEYDPQNDFERKIPTETPLYTETHLIKMSGLHSKLEALYEENQAKFEQMKAKLEALYDRLDVDQGERESFLSAHSICKPSLMLEMELEIERYEELKRQNIGKFIVKIKEELVIEYERCNVSQDQQDNFFSLSTVSGECNEELLELYERELDRMKAYYEENKEMLEKFQRWRTMWKELIELELKANDPNRFNNRGGQLLQEERKRKKLQKGLPEVEKELMALNEKYSANNQGNKFKIFDTNLDEFIAGCWDELNAAKEEEKRERQRAKQTTNKVRKPLQPQVVVKRTPTKRAAGAGVTPTPSKLQCLGTPSNATYRSNNLGMSGSVKKSAPKNNLQNSTTKRSLQPPPGSSLIPKAQHGQVSQRDKTISNSNGSDFSALSLSEQEFEEMIVTCPASAKRTR